MAPRAAQTHESVAHLCCPFSSEEEAAEEKTSSEFMTTPPSSPGSNTSVTSGSTSSSSSSSTSSTDSSGTQAAGEGFSANPTNQGHHKKFKEQGMPKSAKANPAAKVVKPPPVTVNRGAESVRGQPNPDPGRMIVAQSQSSSDPRRFQKREGTT